MILRLALESSVFLCAFVGNRSNDFASINLLTPEIRCIVFLKCLKNYDL